MMIEQSMRCRVENACSDEAITVWHRRWHFLLQIARIYVFLKLLDLI
jgi:hypothetical protein